MRVILIDEEAESRKRLIELLAKKRITEVTALASVQEGIEAIEGHAETAALAICNYRGGSALLFKAFLEATANLPTLLIGELNGDPSVHLEYLPRNDEAAFLSSLDRLRADGILDPSLAPDADFIRVPISSLSALHPPPVDFYLRLASNRYCLRFRKEDGLDAAALEAYAKRPGTQNLYARKNNLDCWLTKQTTEVDQWLGDGQPGGSPRARKAAVESLDVVHNIVSQMGFTPNAEELAKKTVSLTLKALGSSPELSRILQQISQHDGKYISSHSLMLAEVACALAHRLRWSSSTTLLKLTMAAFIHDLSLHGNHLASARTLAEAASLGSAEEKEVLNHPIAAAEFARGFRQLPADVDTIVLQHHEQPDGSGFPRGLINHQISPLACVFIVAQDLLNHFLDFGPTNDNLLKSFLSEQETRYAQGTFRKIYDSLNTGEPATLA